MYKKIFLNITSIIAILFIIDIIYKKWFYENDLKKYTDIDLVRSVPLNTDILYLGESSNSNYNKNDIDRRKISEFIGDHYPSLNVKDITRPAAHAGIYKVYLENIPKESQIKTLIITLNLRSFNAQWIYSDLETPLQKSIVLIKKYPPLINRFLLSFKAYDIKSAAEREKQFKKKWKRDKLTFPYSFRFSDVIQWDKWMANTGIKDEDGNYDNAQTVLACHYIKGYAFQIDTLNNPRIKDFNDIVKLANKRGWNLVFNLMAENTERAEELVGEDLIFLFNQNEKLLINYYESKRVKVVNNLNAVPDKEFTDRDWTTEHYAEKGRKIVAENVAEKIRTLHNKDYVDIDYSKSSQN